MQGIEEDPGYQSTEDDFHLTTSDEFCGGHRSRAAHVRSRGADRAAPILEELDLEELKLWDEEDPAAAKFERFVSMVLNDFTIWLCVFTLGLDAGQNCND